MSQYSTPCTIQYQSKLAGFNGVHWLAWIYNVGPAAAQSSANPHAVFFFLSSMVLVDVTPRWRWEGSGYSGVNRKNPGLRASGDANGGVLLSHPTEKKTAI